MNAKADRLLKDLADIDLIAIKQTKTDTFLQIVERLRSRTELFQPPNIEEINREVEAVRTERYERGKA